MGKQIQHIILSATLLLTLFTYMLSADQKDRIGKFQRRHRRHRRDTIDEFADQRDCSNPDNPIYPTTTTNTTGRIEALREEMINLKDNYDTIPVEDVAAYVIPSGDAHQNEYISECDKRREYITGFNGSAGIAVVTLNMSALWTDGRYWTQAEREMDCNWILMKEGNEDVPSRGEWLARNLPSGVKVVFDPSVMPINEVLEYEEEFKKFSKEIELYPLYEKNLIDEIWEEEEEDSGKRRPECPYVDNYEYNDVFSMNVRWTDRSWHEKVELVRERMVEEGADMFVVQRLDEIAWLFNLRGNDIPFNPVFYAYAVILMDEVGLFVDQSKLRSDARSQINPCSSDDDNNYSPCVDLLDYTVYKATIESLASRREVKRVWMTETVSYDIFDSIRLEDQEKRFLLSPSPVAEVKAVKDEREIDGMILGHLYDAVTVLKFWEWLEDEVERAEGDFDIVNEVIAQEKLKEIKERQEFLPEDDCEFVGLSFETISAYGPNGAVIHYNATEETNRAISDDSMYLLDSGGQYTCGATTDVTRTFHFGKPTSFQKEIYTRILMGVADLALSVFPTETYGSDIDSYARNHLWKLGLDYNHGTGHGIGSFLNVHEGPARIKVGCRDGEVPLSEGMFLSDEPGYYEEDNFGIRLETILRVVEKKTKYNFDNKTFLGFEPVTLVPFDMNLIDREIMTSDQITWVNKYHERICEEVGELLWELREYETRDFLEKKVDPSDRILGWTCTAGAVTLRPTKIEIFMAILTFLTITLRFSAILP